MDPVIAGAIAFIILVLWVIIKIFLKISAWIFWIVVAALISTLLFVISLVPK